MDDDKLWKLYVVMVLVLMTICFFPLRASAAEPDDSDPASVETSDDLGEAPADTEDNPSDAEDAPGEAEDDPADTEDGPADAEDAPADTEDAPADQEDAPADQEDDAPTNTGGSSSGGSSRDASDGNGDNISIEFPAEFDQLVEDMAATRQSLEVLLYGVIPVMLAATIVLKLGKWFADTFIVL